VITPLPGRRAIAFHDEREALAVGQRLTDQLGELDCAGGVGTRQEGCRVARIKARRQQR
jgi:hypothetical protein